MDEAGSHANNQLFRSVAAISAPSSSEPSLLRNLTLGVLIVAGGTLASLPFRRYQAIPDASSDPVHVTGPIQSALDSPSVNQLVDHNQLRDESADQPLSETTSDQTLATIESQLVVSNLPSNYPGWEVPAVPPPRKIDIPLTYEDLAIPIDLPSVIAKRLNATTQVRKKQAERERVAGLVMPATDTLAASQVEQLQHAETRFEPGSLPGEKVQRKVASNAADNARAAGSLASSREGKIERLPQPAKNSRQRQWIRQPQ